MAKDWRTLKLEVLAETTQFVKGMDAANKETQSFGDKLGDFGKKAALALAAVGAAAGAMAIKIGKEAIAAASDLAETTSKVNVIFEEAAGQIEAFGKTAAATLGQTKTQALNAAATFATFGKSAGLTGKALAEFSLEFVQLASDLASFNNTSVDQAITALGAALRGEAEPIRAYGVLLNDATLKAQATAMGIYDGTEKLTVQQKVLAAHQVVLAQTRDAQGDFARTADGMANSQRILTARIEETKIILGEALLPIALQVVNFFNDRLVPVLEKVAGAFGGEGDDGIISRVKQLVTQVRDALAPIIDALQGAFERVSKAIVDNKDNFKDVLEAFQAIWNFSKTYLLPILENRIVTAISGISIVFSALLKAILPIIGLVSDAIKTLLNLIDGAIQRINNLIDRYNRISFLPDVPKIPSANAPITAGGFSAARPVAGTMAANLAASAAQVAVGAAPTAASAPAAAAAAAASATTKAAAATQTGTQVFGLNAFRLGEALSMGQYTINVNAPSIIDEEGFARVMVDALNRAQNRTGGGGGKIEMAML